MLAGLAAFLNIPQLVLGATMVWAVWLGTMFAVALPITDRLLQNAIRWLRPASRIIIAAIAIFAMVEIIGLAVIFISSTRIEGTSGEVTPLAESVMHSFEPADSDALTQQAAQNLLKGDNPYSAANVVTALKQASSAFDKITPLRRGTLAGVFPHPTTNQLRTLWGNALSQPDSPPVEIESNLNYPAGSFLLPAPFVALGIKDIRIAFIILALPALAYAAWRIKPGWRLYFVLGAVLSIEIWNAAAAGDTGMLYFPFLLIAWLLMRRRLWLSALCMGVAIATKQIVWFFLPFYLILILRTMGLRKAWLSLVAAAGVFTVFNLPFVISDPGLWVSSITAPMTDGMFPTGVGLIALVSSGMMHITSALPFAVVEVCVAVMAVVWYYRNCIRYPHAGLVLALLPLFCAWRSLWNYFYYADIILLAAILSEENKKQTAASHGIKTQEVL